MAKYNFQTAGSWDRDDNSGHVHQAPAWIHHILIERIQALWMSSDEITDEEISKNHMAWRLYFSINQPTDVEVEIGDYKSGILSMEVEYDLDEDYTFPRIPDSARCGEDYYPGRFNLKMVSYADMTNSAVHSLTYLTKKGCTLGDFIDSILRRKMEEFIFHVYTPRAAAKGCGHFWWIIPHSLTMVDPYRYSYGLIIDATSIESPHSIFSLDCMRTYLDGNYSTEAPVGRGQFLSISAEENRLGVDEPNDLVPEHVWSVAKSRVSRIISGVDVDSEDAIKLAELRASRI